MKKTLTALVICVAFTAVAQAQSKFSLGPNAGFGGSWISNTPNQKTKAAGNFGLALVYSATEHFGLGADVKYSFEGAKSDEDNINSSIDLNYLRIPVKAYYFFNGYGSRLRPKVGFGPSFGFLNSAKAKSGSESENIKPLFKTFDFGLTGLAGINYRLVQNTWFNADISYMHGLSDVVKNNTGNDQSAHNRNLQLNVGVNFGL